MQETRLSIKENWEEEQEKTLKVTGRGNCKGGAGTGPTGTLNGKKSEKPQRLLRERGRGGTQNVTKGKKKGIQNAGKGGGN